MQSLTMLMIVVATTFDFFTKGDHYGRWAVLPNGSQYVAELLSLAAAVYVLFAGIKNGFKYVRSAYWILFGAVVLIAVLGAFANAVEAGPVFAGIRAYMRAIPWFFVPAAFAFSERNLRSQLRLLALICALQTPFAIQQTAKSLSRDLGFSGDMTVGTLVLSPNLSIFLICALCITAAMFVRKMLKPWQFLALFAVMLLPTIINETKATFVLLPIGAIFAFLVAAKPGRRVRAILLATSALVLSGGVAVPVYNALVTVDNASPIEEFTNPERLERYLWKKQGVGTTKEVGRIDAALVAIDTVVSDPVHVVFGLGIGNVSQSALGAGFDGRYFDLLGPFAAQTGTKLLLELGVAGLLLVFGVLWLIFQDSLWLARRRQDLLGAIAAGWTGVVVIMAVAMSYTQLMTQTSLSFLFWYLSGLLAAERMRQSWRRANSDST